VEIVSLAYSLNSGLKRPWEGTKHCFVALAPGVALPEDHLGLGKLVLRPEI
jgi:hypothetical protein